MLVNPILDDFLLVHVHAPLHVLTASSTFSLLVDNLQNRTAGTFLLDQIKIGGRLVVFAVLGFGVHAIQGKFTAFVASSSGV